MQLKLETASPIPVYLQIVEQIRYSIAAGVLKANDELPSVRALALDYLINPNTVARAYLELEHEGLVSKRRGAGTYVSSSAQSLGSEYRLQAVSQLLEKAVTAANDLGLTPKQVRALLEQKLNHTAVER